MDPTTQRQKGNRAAYINKTPPPSRVIPCLLLSLLSSSTTTTSSLSSSSTPTKMETKSLMRSSSLPYQRRGSRTSFSKRRCVAVHVGSGERDQVRNGPDLVLRRTKSDTETVVPDKKNQRENQRIREYYQEMLRSDPGNSLLLRNYGKFLHEVCVVLSKDRADSSANLVNFLLKLFIDLSLFNYRWKGMCKGQWSAMREQ